MQTLASQILGELRRRPCVLEELVDSLSASADEIEAVLEARSNDLLFIADGDARWSVAGAHDITGCLRTSRDLRPWQVQALQEWVADDRRAISEAVTGAGKTELGVVAMLDAHRRGVPVLVLVPDQGMVTQWVETIGQTFPRMPIARPDSSPRLLFSEGLIVSTPNAIANRRLGAFEHAGLIIADEIHRFGIGDYQQSVLPFKGAKERLGLTACYEWKDKQAEAVFASTFGRRLESCDHPRAIEEKALAAPLVLTVGVSFTEKERDGYRRLSDKVEDAEESLKRTGVDLKGGLYEAAVRIDEDGTAGEVGFQARKYLAAFEARRRSMAECEAKLRAISELSSSIDTGDRIAVFTNNWPTSAAIAEAVGGSGVRAEAIREDDDKSLSLSRFRQGTTRVLATDRLLDEGVEMPNAQIGVLAVPPRTRAQMLARMGRIIQPVGAGCPTVFVVVYVKGTAEDPVYGAEGTHFGLLQAAADHVREVDVEDVPTRVAEWQRDLATTRSAESPLTGVGSSEQEWDVSDALMDILDELGGVATSDEIREVLPDLEVRELIMGGLSELTWMTIGACRVVIGGRENPPIAERILALDTLATAVGELEGCSVLLSDLTGLVARAELLADLSTPRVEELWRALGGTFAVQSQTPAESLHVPGSTTRSPVAPPAPLPTEPPVRSLHTAVLSKNREALPPVAVVEAKQLLAKAIRRREGLVLEDDEIADQLTYQRPGGKPRTVRVLADADGTWTDHVDQGLTDTGAYFAVVLVDRTETLPDFYILSAHRYQSLVGSSDRQDRRENLGRPQNGLVTIRPDGLGFFRNNWKVLNLRERPLPAGLAAVPAVSAPASTAKKAAKAGPKKTSHAAAARSPVAIPADTELPTDGAKAGIRLSANGEVEVSMRIGERTVTGLVDPKTEKLCIESASVSSKKFQGRTFRNPAVAAATIRSEIEKRTVFCTGHDDWVVDVGAGLGLREFLAQVHRKNSVRTS